MNTYLPELKGFQAGIRKGRNVYEGYQRGWGLQFGGLREKVLDDPLYREALAAAGSRSVMSEANRMNLFLIMKFFLGRCEFGHIVEYGAYLCGNAIFMAYIARKLYPGMTVFALDSFAGMPATDKAVDAHNRGDFSGADPKLIRKDVERLGLSNLIIVKGDFSETAPGVMAEAGKVALAHIDCDIRSAVDFSYENVKPFMSEGGYIVFDDANVSSCIGATEVVEDKVIRRDGLNSEQIWPHFVFRSFKKRGGGVS